MFFRDRLRPPSALSDTIYAHENEKYSDRGNAREPFYGLPEVRSVYYNYFA